MNRLDRWLSLGLVLTLGFLLGILGFSLWDKLPSPATRVAWSSEAQWIAPQESSHRFYARRTFDLPDTAKAGWLRLSADNDFLLYVNGKVVAREHSVINNSLSFASKLSDPYQNINDSTNYYLKTIVQDLLANARDWKLTAYVDLAPYLRPGKNVIALEIQKGQQSPRVVVEGFVYPVAEGPPINLTTGATPWQVSSLFQSRQQVLWFEPDFPAQSWPEAKAIGSVAETTYSRLSPQLFDRLLQGTWITGTESPQGEVWLRGHWQLPKSPLSRAFIRFTGDGEYALLLNGLLVNRYGVNDGNKLHMYEVTNLLKAGLNTLAVRLARPLDQDFSVSQNGSLGFFLDGWVETNQNSITAPIATDSTWSALNQPIPGWAESIGQGQPATILSPPDQQEFRRTFEGNAYLLNYPDYLWRISLWQLAGMGCALAFAWSLGRFGLGRWNSWWDSIGAGAGLLLPGTLFLIGIGLLKHRYAESEEGLLFVQPQSNPLILLGFLGIVVSTLLWSQMGQASQNQHISGLKILPRWGLWFLLGLIGFVSLGLAVGGMSLSRSSSILLIFLSFGEVATLTLLWNRVRWSLRDSFKAVLKTWPTWGHWFLLALIVGIGFGLRAYGLDLQAYDSDENISLDAIRGILRTGAPEATSGIWYTRGPFYHYMVALWLSLVGDSAVNARFLSVLWGTATLILAFVFTRKITGNVWIALVVTAILAIDPWEIWYSRTIRFYQIVQCVNLLVFWSFFKGFIDRAGRVYQYVFFIALTVMLTSQEVTLLLLPCFLLGFLFFYRPFRLSFDWPIVLGSFMVMAIYAYDGIVFSIICLTPWVALSSSTDSYLKFHLAEFTGFFAGLFVAPSRMNTLYSFFFFLGFVYFIIRRQGKLVFLFSVVLIKILLLTLMVYQIGTRYSYAVYPIFVLLAVYSAVSIIETLGRRLEFSLKSLLPLRTIACGFLALLLISNLEPNRVLAGYHDAINRNNTQLFEYISQHKQPGDVVFASNAPAAAIGLNGLDYFLPKQTLPFDAFYLHEGRLIERVAGGVVVTNLDQINRVLENAKRVWIHLDDARATGFAPELVDYFKTLGKPVMESFGVRLRLWQPEDGLLRRVPNQGKDLGNY